MNTLINIGITFGILAGSYLFLCIVFAIRTRNTAREAMKMINQMQELEAGLMDNVHKLSPPPMPKVKDPKK
jgi:hypothetical protein